MQYSRQNNFEVILYINFLDCALSTLSSTLKHGLNVNKISILSGNRFISCQLANLALALDFIKFFSNDGANNGATANKIKLFNYFTPLYVVHDSQRFNVSSFTQIFTSQNLEITNESILFSLVNHLDNSFLISYNTYCALNSFIPLLERIPVQITIPASSN